MIIRKKKHTGEPLRLVQKLERKYRQLVKNSLKIDIDAEPIVAAAGVVHAPGFF